MLLVSALANVWVVSGPIRKKLWMPSIALLVGIVLIMFLISLLNRPDILERVQWLFPLKDKWLRCGLLGLSIGIFAFCLILLATNGLGFFEIFPWLAK